MKKQIPFFNIICTALMTTMTIASLFTVSVSASDNENNNSMVSTSSDAASLSDENAFPDVLSLDMEDGEYSIQVDLEGGSGKASVSSPALMTVTDGHPYVRLQWSSSNYDYMIVNNEKYLPVNEDGGNSVFDIPILIMDEAMPVIADTTAMGAPREIHYTLTFYSESVGSKSQMPQEAAKRVVAVALVIIVSGGILNYFVNKRRRC